MLNEIRAEQKAHYAKVLDVAYLADFPVHESRQIFLVPYMIHPYPPLFCIKMRMDGWLVDVTHIVAIMSSALLLPHDGTFQSTQNRPANYSRPPGKSVSQLTHIFVLTVVYIRYEA